MVIIARELAVTGLRAVAVEQGVVISASWLGKVKTMLQVAAIFALIISNPSPTWVDVLVYLAVVVTVISGADYFFGLRRRVDERERAARRDRPRRGRTLGEPPELGVYVRRDGRLEPFALGHVAARVLAALELGDDLGEQPRALGDHGVAVDRLEVLLAGEDEAAVAELREGLGDAPDHLANAVLDESRIEVRLLDHGHLV